MHKVECGNDTDLDSIDSDIDTEVFKVFKYRSTFGWSLSNFVALLRYNLFTYRNLWEWINNPYETPTAVPDYEQLSLRGI